MTSKTTQYRIRVASAYALCRKDGHDPEVHVDGTPLWETYLPQVDKVLDESLPQSEVLNISRKQKIKR